MWPVDIGGIEKCNSELERAVQCRDGFLFVASAIEIRHAHATEADRRHNRPATAEFSLFHKSYSARELRECNFARTLTEAALRPIILLLFLFVSIRVISGPTSDLSNPGSRRAFLPAFANFAEHFFSQWARFQ